MFLKKTFPQELTLEGMRVVLDCANGAAYKVGPTVLSELDSEVFAIGDEPNGKNINDGVGSVYPESHPVEGQGAARGRRDRLDGDADRCQMVDEKGNLSTATRSSRWPHATWWSAAC